MCHKIVPEYLKVFFAKTVLGKKYKNILTYFQLEISTFINKINLALCEHLCPTLHCYYFQAKPTLLLQVPMTSLLFGLLTQRQSRVKPYCTALASVCCLKIKSTKEIQHF